MSATWCIGDPSKNFENREKIENCFYPGKIKRGGTNCRRPSPTDFPVGVCLTKSFCSLQSASDSLIHIVILVVAESS